MENITESKNLFKYDMPVGRKQFIINTLIIVLTYTLVFMLFCGLRLFLGASLPVAIILITLFLLTYLLMFYCMVINYAKRFYDITGDKQKSLLYVVLFFVLIFTLSFIKTLMIATFILTLILAGFALIKKGKILNFDKQKAETPQNEE